ncbi:MAG TPA: hypothetical protein VII69_07850 [Candidatus Eremiobacteraceae bacterium]
MSGHEIQPCGVALRCPQLLPAENGTKLLEHHTEHLIITAREEHRECDLNNGTLA